MNPTSLPTHFAPAERAAVDVVRRQHDEFIAIPPLQRQLLDAIPDILLVLNAQRQVVFSNKALLDSLGLENASQVLGQRPGEFLRCAHALEEPGGCGTSEFCRTCGAAQAILASLGGSMAIRECRIIQESGHALDWRVKAVPLVLEGESYSVFTVQDIAHEKRRQALEHIFFHDLLNIAQVIQGFAALMEGDSANGRTEAYIEAIYRASNQLVDEINTQRDLNMAENGELAPELERVDSLAFLRDVQANYQHHVGAKERTIRLDEQAQQACFTSDPILLRRVVGNMVKNALEAVEPGDTVALGCRIDGEWIAFDVHNPGYMPRDVQLQVFQRSFSTKGRGRGLGTYSMKLLSERYLGGTVTFATSPESGTTFTAWYPLAGPAHS